jgi:hypothetical protein
MTISYPSPTASLPDAAFTWLDNTGDVLDFSSGWTFVLKIGRFPNAAVVTKTTGLTGQSTAPNLIVHWDINELHNLTPGRWVIQVTATYTDGRQRIMDGVLKIDAPALV